MEYIFVNDPSMLGGGYFIRRDFVPSGINESQLLCAGPFDALIAQLNQEIKAKVGFTPQEYETMVKGGATPYELKNISSIHQAYNQGLIPSKSGVQVVDAFNPGSQPVQNKILGMEPKTALMVGGLAIAGIFFLPKLLK